MKSVQNKFLGAALLISLLLMQFQNVFAATEEHELLYTQTQYNGVLQVDGKPEISFIKPDGSVINWDNPLTIEDDINAVYSFGLKAEFDLSNIDQIVDKVSDGEIPGIPSLIRAFIQSQKGSAVIIGSFDLSIDINPGLGDYFSVDQDVLNSIKANPDLLLAANPAYGEVFEVTEVTESSNVINIRVHVKDGVVGQKVLDLKNNFGTIDFQIDNLLVLNPQLWDDVDQVNRGEFNELVTISAPATTFVINIPDSLLSYAGLVGAHNPFVGVKLEMESNSGALNLGFIVAYDGNGSDSGSEPVDASSPYPDGGAVTVLEKGSLSRDGYKFIGWSRNATITDDSELVAPGSTFNIDNNTIFYAQWRALTADDYYTVRYEDGVSDEVVFEDQVYSDIVVDSITPSFAGTPSRDGYNFTGWLPEVSATVTGDATYVAQWEVISVPERYTVRYEDGVSGEVVFEDQVYPNLESGSATPGFEGTPSRAGYNFTGWLPEVSATVTADATYVAQWEIISAPERYTVRYEDGVSGEVVFEDQVYPNLESGSATPGFVGTPSRVGYNFVGWTPKISATVVGDVTYTAQWEIVVDSVSPRLPNTGVVNYAPYFGVAAIGLGIIYIVISQKKKSHK